jgi:phage terminase large subunit-like protein
MWIAATIARRSRTLKRACSSRFSCGYSVRLAQQVDQIKCYSRAYPRYERFRPSVVLIEDEASGTQLIQELITEGLQGVTRYQPQAGTVMRVHAHTAMIENSFVRVPDTARDWRNTCTR